MNMAGDIEAMIPLIERFGIGKRASLAVSHGDTGYFAVTPEAPYDAALSTGEQTRQLLAKADRRLAEIGSDRVRHGRQEIGFSRRLLLFVAIMIADMDDLAEMNAAWDDWVEGIAPPSRACFQARLANTALKVEMIMIAAVAGKEAGR